MMGDMRVHFPELPESSHKLLYMLEGFGKVGEKPERSILLLP
jgi:hypothetical protein